MEVLRRSSAPRAPPLQQVFSQIVAPPVPLRLRTTSPDLYRLLEAHSSAIETMVRTRGPVVLDRSTDHSREPGTVLTLVAALLADSTGVNQAGTVEVLVGLKGLVAADKERSRVNREMKQVEKDLLVMNKKLGSSAFLDRAPADVVAESKAQRAALAEARERLATIQTRT